jgi:Tol biopolymer transport system component
LATGSAQKLGDRATAFADETPAWFPDGQKLAFQSNRSGQMEIWVMKADGTQQRQVTGIPKIGL